MDFSLARNKSRNIGKNISKTLSSKYSQKLIDHTKQSATDARKNASKRALPKIAESAGALIGIKLLIQLQESQKINHRIIQKQIEKKYLEQKFVPP